MRSNNIGVVIVREQRKPDMLDVREVVASALDGFCGHFQLAGAAVRRSVLLDMSRQAREMAEEITR